jgi:hypothetical protein
LNDVLATDHAGLNKYSSEQDANLKKINGVLKDMIDKLPQKQTTSVVKDQSTGMKV